MKKELSKKIIGIVLLAVLGTASFFAAGGWAKEPANYRNTMATLNSIENKAVVMTGTSIALATAAALVPGDATTPIANKLADVAGYMVIVYAAIVIEKYLLALTGIAAFQILIPFSVLLLILNLLFPSAGRRIDLKRTAVKLTAVGLMLWALVPASAAVTNIINSTYAISYDAELNAGEKTSETIGEIDDSEESAQKSDLQEEEKKEDVSLKRLWNNLAEKTGAVSDALKDKASAGVADLQNSLNHMLEGVAVMIVTTCVIPLGVLMLFLWIIKRIIGLDASVRMPKASKLLPASRSSGEKEDTQA